MSKAVNVIDRLLFSFWKRVRSMARIVMIEQKIRQLASRKS